MRCSDVAMRGSQSNRTAAVISKTGYKNRNWGHLMTILLVGVLDVPKIGLFKIFASVFRYRIILPIIFLGGNVLE